MPLDKGYAVLKAHAIDRRPARKIKDHYSVHVFADQPHYRLAVNIRSVAKNFGPDLWFHLDDDFQHPITSLLKELPMGIRQFPFNTSVAERRESGICLDFIRMNLFDFSKMKLLPGMVDGANNDMNERIDGLVQDMMGDGDSVLYAFGEPWFEPRKTDKFFGFLPGAGVHNLHMNQGDLTGDYSSEDGVYQDGALIFYYPSQNRYVGYFTKFQSQSWHTNDDDGHAVDGRGVPVPDPDTGHQIRPNPDGHSGGTADGPDNRVRIIAAMVNAVGPSPEAETVTLLNTTARAIDLTGWKLADKQKNKMPLSGSIAKGAARLVPVAAPMQLSNSGGIITLLNPHGIKVHGVKYTAVQAKPEGETIVFVS